MSISSINLLQSDNFIISSKDLIKKVGFSSAGIFSELCNKHKFFFDRNLLKDGYFPYPILECEKEFGLKRREQETIFKKLEEINLINKKIIKLSSDSSPRRYIKILKGEN